LGYSFFFLGVYFNIFFVSVRKAVSGLLPPSPPSQIPPPSLWAKKIEEEAERERSVGASLKACEAAMGIPGKN
jgi:hypothetical protein